MTDKEFFRRLVLEQAKTQSIGNRNDTPYCVNEARRIYESVKATEAELNITDAVLIKGEDLVRVCKRFDR